METNKLGQEPAFSFVYERENIIYGEKENVVIPGMSKRFYAACAAMQGILSNRGPYYQAVTNNDPFENLGGEIPEYCAKIAYQFADELLKQENL